jgi:hypothetical protein
MIAETVLQELSRSAIQELLTFGSRHLILTTYNLYEVKYTIKNDYLVRTSVYTIFFV